jgi:hypothetical protein
MKTRRLSRRSRGTKNKRKTRKYQKTRKYVKTRKYQKTRTYKKVKIGGDEEGIENENIYNQGDIKRFIAQRSASPVEETGYRKIPIPAFNVVKPEKTIEDIERQIETFQNALEDKKIKKKMKKVYKTKIERLTEERKELIEKEKKKIEINKKLNTFYKGQDNARDVRTNIQIKNAARAVNKMMDRESSERREQKFMDSPFLSSNFSSEYRTKHPYASFSKDESPLD